jgi:hypothetical protein
VINFDQIDGDGIPKLIAVLIALLKPAVFSDGATAGWMAMPSCIARVVESGVLVPGDLSRSQR